MCCPSEKHTIISKDTTVCFSAFQAFLSTDTFRMARTMLVHDKRGAIAVSKTENWTIGKSFLNTIYLTGIVREVFSCARTTIVKFHQIHMYFFWRYQGLLPCHGNPCWLMTGIFFVKCHNFAWGCMVMYKNNSYSWLCWLPHIYMWIYFDVGTILPWFK